MGSLYFLFVIVFICSTHSFHMHLMPGGEVPKFIFCQVGKTGFSNSREEILGSSYFLFIIVFLCSTHSFHMHLLPGGEVPKFIFLVSRKDRFL